MESQDIIFVFVDNLGVILNNTNIGSQINGTKCNHIRYADDLYLILICQMQTCILTIVNPSLSLLSHVLDYLYWFFEVPF